MPVEWVISRLCEEFHCLPSAVMGEDTAMVFNILALRGYARARETILRLDGEEDENEAVLKRAGISEALVVEVMTNIERAANG